MAISKGSLKQNKKLKNSANYTRKPLFRLLESFWIITKKRQPETFAKSFQAALCCSADYPLRVNA
ncbi:hypothetical protein [Wielerella bovis]|uniref:hypothetical protein n=1 Tax=Wielerella bovis TaxID=2917790 RepID=UPI0020185B4C|nr:hypothetical protein [Wielerella bovis]ULJ62040.1 hypothetical protein MIS46_08615 [Wielerella bovis]ULJ64265.1 hypothetical protein MIS33_08920 [Wielerella bovis]ULJ66484.1 hypothetical protein MIS31_09525 [Wielerella bovis]ULJ68802.1 hypothetical protein MIS45_08445 [Wielerella bovis]